MCKALYIASDSPLPESQWNELNPGFYLEALKASGFLVRPQFSKSHVYFAGAHGGCGCGFGFGDPADPILDDEDILGRRSLDELFGFLHDQIKTARSLEMYFCWEGDEGLPRLGLEHLHLDRFILPQDTFYLPERTLINVVHA